MTQGLNITGRIAALTVIALVAACATTTSGPDGQRAPTTSVTIATETPVVSPPVVRESQLTGDVLYKLLVAEIAGQRGKIDVALHNYLELAGRLNDPQIAERAARIAVFARNTDKALEAARRWVELAPHSVEARQIIAAMYIRAGDIDASLENLEYVLSVHSENAGATLQMIANFLGREEDKDVALTVMERLIQRRKDDPDALLAYALLAIRAEDTDRARQAMDKVAEFAPEHLSVAMAYLSVLQRQGDIKTALEWLENALDRNPGNFELRMVYARMLADAKRFDDAAEQFELLGEQDPEHADVQYALGLLYLQSSQMDQAKEHFTYLAEHEERRHDASFYLGQIAESNKEYTQALAHYQQMEEGDHYFDAQLHIALILSKQGDISAAREQLRDIPVSGEKQELMVVRVEGELLTEQGQLEEAMAIYDKALREHTDTELLYTRAMLAEKMGNLARLEEDLRAIIELEPENVQALNALGYTLADRTNRHQEALELITKALEHSPDDFYILDSMGWVLYRLGRLDEAIPYLRRARAIRDDPEVAAHLAEVLWVLGDKDGARDVWESALQTTPDDEKLLDVIKRLTP